MSEAIVWAPSELLAALNQTLEYAYTSVEVEGEVASFKVNQNKYVFFDLKDDDSSLGCFMTLFNLRQPIEDGMKVRLRARPQITKWGKFSLVVEQITPVGEGSIRQAQEILKAKLAKEGLFDSSRKRSLPAIPEAIGLISSEQAAGFADFNRILNERWGGLKIVFYHSQVQGEAAPDQIIAALNRFNQSSQPPDLIAIIRGGGSADDLACFNDEKLVRSISASRIPVITGIGHEIDQSLSDLAADVAAATPTHAAQLIVPDKKEFIKTLRIQLADIKDRLLVDIKNQQQIIIERLDQAKMSLERQIDWIGLQLKNSEQLLESYNPRQVLARGYAILRGVTEVGAVIEVETLKNIIKAEVKDVSDK